MSQSQYSGVVLAGNTVQFSLSITDQSGNSLIASSTSASVFDPSGALKSSGALTYISATQLYTYVYTSQATDLLGAYKLDVNALSGGNVGRAVVFFNVIDK